MKTLQVKILETIYQKEKEKSLFGKWVHYEHISPLLNRLSSRAEVSQIGASENNLPVCSLKLGSGKNKILIWSQMHGNESTGTKAVFDFFNCMTNSDNLIFEKIIKECTILCIPMLNPDGAYNYTRVNANGIDLNRDAVAKKAKESVLLREIMESFSPQFCFNLHDQRTIFGVEGTKKPASVSFLAPSEDITRKITPGRRETMNVIVAMNLLLQQVVPNHIGRYTDEFYPTATGDNFQKLGCNTVLIEAGHFPNDYDREEVRKLTLFALIQGIYHIATTDNYKEYMPYFDIPNNKKNFFDVIEKNIETKESVAYQYEDKVVDGKLTSKLLKQEVKNLSNYLAHKLVILEK